MQTRENQSQVQIKNYVFPVTGGYFFSLVNEVLVMIQLYFHAHTMQFRKLLHINRSIFVTKISYGTG